MAIVYINGKEYKMKEGLEVINGDYYVDGVKVGSDDTDYLTYQLN